LITPNEDANGGDTVIGLTTSAGFESASILDLLFEGDGLNTTNRTRFAQDILSAMKNGSFGLREFWRMSEDGNNPEQLW